MLSLTYNLGSTFVDRRPFLLHALLCNLPYTTNRVILCGQTTRRRASLVMIKTEMAIPLSSSTDCTYGVRVTRLPVTLPFHFERSVLRL